MYKYEGFVYSKIDNILTLNCTNGKKGRMAGYSRRKNVSVMTAKDKKMLIAEFIVSSSRSEVDYDKSISREYDWTMYVG